MIRPRVVLAVPPLALWIACAAAGGCKPWTVRPIGEGAVGGASSMTFDAARYVVSIWESKVVPAADGSALDLTAVLGGPRQSVLVKGRARVTSVDLRSRVGLAFLDVGAGQTRVALLVGPVLRGTALRDALPFIRFTDFVNQIDYASVASELNQRAQHAALDGVNTNGLEGKTVSFQGAVTIGGAAQTTVEIVPLSLRVEGTER